MPTARKIVNYVRGVCSNKKNFYLEVNILTGAVGKHNAAYMQQAVHGMEQNLQNKNWIHKPHTKQQSTTLNTINIQNSETQLRE